jgi:TctA family transporter
MSRGNPTVFFANSISLGFLLMIVALIVGSVLMNKRKASV